MFLVINHLLYRSIFVHKVYGFLELRFSAALGALKLLKKNAFR